MITAVQIMAVLYFLAAIRLKAWKTSLNTFIVFATAFLITVLANFDICIAYWVDLHLSIVSAMLTFMMGRVVYQKIKGQMIC